MAARNAATIRLEMVSLRGKSVIQPHLGHRAVIINDDMTCHNIIQ